MQGTGRKATSRAGIRAGFKPTKSWGQRVCSPWRERKMASSVQEPGVHDGQRYGKWTFRRVKAR